MTCGKLQPQLPPDVKIVGWLHLEQGYYQQRMHHSSSHETSELLDTTRRSVLQHLFVDDELAPARPHDNLMDISTSCRSALERAYETLGEGGG